MQTVFEYINKELTEVYDAAEIRNISFLLISEITGQTLAEILAGANMDFSPSQYQTLNNFLHELKKQTPIQYVLGKTEFYGLEFIVNHNALIPRPETEELIEWIISDKKNEEPISILDIGTGSGCIAITLNVKIPNASVSAFDISEGALTLSNTNALKHQVKINFQKVDILNTINLSQKWDIIVSNPPYIPESEKKAMDKNVLEHEPKIALFVPNNDPLLFYRNITSFAKKHLSPMGKLYFETHYDMGEACSLLLKEAGFTGIELRKDLSGNDRMLKAIANF